MVEMESWVIKIQADASDAVKKMEDIGRGLTFSEKAAAKFGKVVDGCMASSSSKTQKLGSALADMANVYKGQAESFSSFLSQLKGYETELGNLGNAYTDQAAAIEETKGRITELETAYADALAQQKAMLSARGTYSTEELAAATEQTRAYGDELSKLKIQLSSMEAAHAETAGSIRDFGGAVGETQTALQEIAGRAGETRGEITQMAQAAQVQTMSEGFNEAAAAVGGFGSAVAAAAKTVVSKMGAAAKTIGTGVVNAAKKAAGGVKSLISHFSKARKESLSLSSAAKKLTSTFGSFANMLVRRFKRSIISAAFNGLKDGIKNLAQESASFNSAMSGMMAAAQRFGNSIAAAFGPLITAAAPIVTRFVNILSSAMDTVAQFTAKLTGQTTYQKALPVVADYASSVSDASKAEEKSAKSTEKKTKAAEKLKRTLMSFDEIHQLAADDDNGGNTDTSSSSISTPEVSAPKFEEVAIKSNAFTAFADKLAAAFKKHDWKKLGKTMADGVNAAFAWTKNAIAWENVGGRITAVCKAITETFNSFISGVNWSLIGETVGAGIMTVVRTLSLLVTGIDWQNLGASFGVMVRSLFESVRWDEIGALFIDGVQSVVSILYGFVTTPGLFASIAEGIRSTLAGAIAAIDPALWGSTAAGLINGFFEVVKGLFTVENFTAMGETFTAAFNQMVEDIDPATIAEGVSSFCLSLFSLLTTTLEGIDWWDFGLTIAECIRSIDWGGIAQGTREFVGSLLGGTVAFLFGLVGQTCIDICDYWQGQMEEAGGNILLGIFNGIIEGLIGIASWWYKSFVEPFINGFKKAFQLKPTSKIMIEHGKKVGEGILSGILAAFKNITGWIKKHIVEPILGGVKTAFGIVGGVAGKMKDLGGNIMNGLKNGIEGAAETVKTAAGNIAGGIKDKFWSGIEGIKNFGADIMNGFKSLFEGVTIKLPHFTWDWVQVGPVSIPTFGGIQWYANGGFPDAGEMFVARENGPEMVGRMGSRSVVANNSQIVDGIKQGVMEAMIMTMGRQQENNNNGGDIVLNVDGIELARCVNRSNKKLNRAQVVFA